MSKRRELIKASIAAGTLGIGLSACTPQVRKQAKPVSSQPKLDILILGGTGFIGPHMVRDALSRGHRVTLFNRGKTNTGLFPELETLIGDRDGNLTALEGRRWDAVIDNSGRVPRHVRDSATLLSTAAQQYLFVSSVSAYDNFGVAGIDENHPLATMPDETVEEVTGATYGPMKALCEQAVSQAFPTGATIIRPGFIVGPGDRSDRWTYWPVRMDRGGAMLAPGSATDPVQIIDARDLAQFVIGVLERKTVGTFNLTGPAEQLTMGTMLAAMKTATGSDATLRWVDAATLDSHNARVPIWTSPSGPYSGIHLISNASAKAQGLTFTPLAKTVRDTLSWWQSLDAARRAAMRSGLRVVDSDSEPTGSQSLSIEQQLTLEAELLARLDNPAAIQYPLGIKRLLERPHQFNLSLAATVR